MKWRIYFWLFTITLFLLVFLLPNGYKSWIFGTFWFFSGYITLYSPNFAIFHILLWIPSFFLVLLNILDNMEAGPLYFCFFYPLYFLHCYFYINVLDEVSDDDKDEFFIIKDDWTFHNAPLLLFTSFISVERFVIFYYLFLIIGGFLFHIFANHLSESYLWNFQCFFLMELDLFFFVHETVSSFY